MMISKILPLMAIASLCAGLPQAKPASSYPAIVEELPLSSLQAGCSMSKRWVGSAFQRPWGAWIECGGQPMLMTHPLNLLWKVNIETSAQALEFVRFFSSGHSYEMFDLEGLLEIRSDTVVEDWGQDIIVRVGLGSASHEPIVKETGGAAMCIDKNGSEFQCQMKLFNITRIVALYDQNIYEITESVRQNGFYSRVSQRLLIENVERFGFLHQGSY